MSNATALQFPCRSRWCAVRGLMIVALWVVLLAGFVAEITAPASPGGGPAAEPVAASSPL